MAAEMETSGTGSERHLVVDIDGQDHRIQDPELSGRQVLEIAGKRPIDEFIVFWLGKNNVLQDLPPDKTVHLHRNEVERFLTFRSDRSYRFDVDSKREDWGASTISEETIRWLAGAGDDSRVWLERKGETDRLIERREFVELTGPGIERFRTERVLKITVVNEDNGREFTIDGFRTTTIDSLIAQMYQELGVPRRADDRLRCEEGGKDVFGFGSLTLGQYVEKGHCKCLVWLFAGGTGGAACQ